jgi:hypothetical protein
MAKKKKRPGLYIFQILVVIGILTLLWSSFGQSVLEPQQQALVPARLGDLELTSAVEGASALTQVSQLHGTDITLTAAYIAEYASDNERVTVWMGQAETESDAAGLNAMMLVAIANGNSPFSNPSPLSVAGHEVFQVDSASGRHFFYQSREDAKSVIWLEIEAFDTLSMLEQAVTIF